MLPPIDGQALALEAVLESTRERNGPWRFASSATRSLPSLLGPSESNTSSEALGARTRPRSCDRDGRRRGGPVELAIRAKCSRFDETAADRVSSELDAVAHPQLLQDVRTMALYGLDADHEHLGDVL